MLVVRAALRKPAWDLVLLAVLPVLLHWRSLDAGLFLDDFALLARLDGWQNGVPGASWWDLYVLGAYDERLRFSGLLPWWTAEGIQLHFFRPVAAASHALDVQLWAGRPWMMHLHSALWLSAATVAGRSLYSQFMGSRLSTISAAVFATSFVHAWPVGWIANRNALIALTFGALAVRAYVRARERAKTPWQAALCLLLSLLSSEAGLACFAYVGAYEVTRGRAHPKRRPLALVMVVAVAAGWRLVYSQTGFGAVGSGAYIDPLHSPGAFAGLVPERGGAVLRYLLSPTQGLSVGDSTTHLVLEVALLAVAVPVLWYGFREKNRFWLLGALLALVPMLTSIAQPRLLGPSVLGFAPLVAGTLAAAWNTRQTLGRMLALALGIVHLGVSPFAASRIVADAGLSEGLGVRASGLQLGDLRGTNLIILSAPTLMVAQEVNAARVRSGLSVPSFTWILAVGDATLGRRGCCTVVARDAEGLFRERGAALYRGHQVPFAVGDRVKTLAFEAEVVSAENGLATEVAFTFGGPLRSKQYVLAQWTGSDFEVVRPRQLRKLAADRP
ncbi:MAG: hypothetical protein ACRBN8_08780 [Nannocystales bacterium]